MRLYIYKLISGFLLFLFLTHCGSGSQNMKYRIKKGDFSASISEAGELSSVRSRVITMPFIGWKYGWNFKLVGLGSHGEKVSEGDSIAQFDTQSVLKYLMEKKNALEVEKAALNMLEVEHLSRMKGLQADLAMAEATLDLNRIQLDKHQFASDRKREIQSLEFEKAQIQFDKTLKKVELTKKIMANELKIQQTKLVQLKNEIEDSEFAINKLKIISPLDGMLQLLKNRRTRQTVRIGDELHQGSKFASIPDLSEMQVTAKVNETDIGKIYVGQPIEIRLDAFPKLMFHGKISTIGKLSYKEDKNDLSKIFDVVILMEESDPVLKPGMTVRCDFIVADLKDTYFVENDCVYNENGSHFLMVGSENKCKRCNVKIGPRNHQFTVIYGDFKKGEKVVPMGKLGKEDLKTAML